MRGVNATSSLKVLEVASKRIPQQEWPERCCSVSNGQLYSLRLTIPAFLRHTLSPLLQTRMPVWLVGIGPHVYLVANPSSYLLAVSCLGALPGVSLCTSTSSQSEFSCSSASLPRVATKRLRHLCPFRSQT